jgi:hypothetical protein
MSRRLQFAILALAAGVALAAAPSLVLAGDDYSGGSGDSSGPAHSGDYSGAGHDDSYGTPDAAEAPVPSHDGTAAPDADHAQAPVEGHDVPPPPPPPGEPQ